MTDTLTPTEPDAPPDDDPQPDEDVRAAAHMRSITDTRSARSAPAAPATTPALFRSFGEFAQAVAMGAVPPAQRAQLYRALADEITSDVPGLMPPAWVREVIDLMGEVSGTINAFRSMSLPDSGMTVTLPRVDQGPDVGVQAAEKTAIATRKVLIGAVPFPVKTYAGGQDISIQVLTRSDPSYLDVVMRLYAKEMALQLNGDLSAAVVAAAAAGPAWPADLVDLGAAIIDASLVIIEATYAMPQVAVLGRDAWAAMGKAKGTDGRPLFPGVSPTNPVGSFSLNTNTGDARGLDYVMDPTMAPDTIVIGIRDAAISMLGPLGTLAADNPEKLGRDHAVYRFAAFGVTDPRGLVKITGAPASLSASSASKTSKGS